VLRIPVISGWRYGDGERVSSAGFDIRRAAAAEGVGTALLVAAVVGSGIMAERLAGGNAALALLANSLATGAALLALIFTFGPISGAHFNPVVSLALAMEGVLTPRRLAIYVTAQLAGALTGLALTHLMFDLPVVQLSAHARSGSGQFVSEIVATFGLLAVIHGTGRRASVVPLTVAAYITAAYWFTASTSFANPAVTIARAFTNTFSGIRPADAPFFIGAQLIGAVMATLFFRWLLKLAATEKNHGG
jgi:glycerol uptake facilitator-like aquaporin